MCVITAVYSLWSFSSWQLQNCSVEHNEMCTGKVTVLGMCYTTVRCYMWKCRPTLDYIFNSAVLVRSPNMSITRITYLFRHTIRGSYLQILIFEIRGGKHVLEEGLRGIASKRRDMSGCCLWDPLLDRFNCFNSSHVILFNNPLQDINILHIWNRWTKLRASPCTVWFSEFVGTFKKVKFELLGEGKIHVLANEIISDFGMMIYL